MKGNRAVARRLRLFALLALPVMAACDDSFGPRPWDASPDTVTLYSASRPELLGLPAGFDFIQPQRVLLEAPGGASAWDIALIEEEGRFVLLPSGAFEPLVSRAAIAASTETSLEAVERAPDGADAFGTEGLPIEVGAIYIVRTRAATCDVFGTSGSRYAKLQAIEIDEAMGTFRFAAVSNPFCNDRALIPPEDD
jgi:hypothetical protein